MVILSFVWLKLGLLVIGFVFLVYMGWVSWQSQPASNQTLEGGSMPPAKQILFAASVSLLNPHAILDTIGVIGTSSLNYIGSDKALFTASCIMVSWLWFFALAFAGRIMGSLDAGGRLLRVVGRVSAMFIWGAALYLGYGIVNGL